MPLTVRKAETLAALDAGWFRTRHQFAETSGLDLSRQGFGALKLWGTDVIRPQSGFDPHPHRDLEIVTVVLEGELMHEDSLGNRAALGPGDVAIMSAGSGIVHSERNDSDLPLRLHQIWMLPDFTDAPPSWTMVTNQAALCSDVWRIRASGHLEAPARLNLRATVATAELREGQSAGWVLAENRAAYVVIGSGSLRISDGQLVLEAGDGLALTAAAQLCLLAAEDSHVVLIDLPSPRAEEVHIPL